jgi:esterase/lipase superfamily enzyme
MATFARDATGVATGDVLFFVHGYNVGIAAVDTEQNNVKTGLAGKFPCTVISFDWPSWTNTFAYLAELDTAKKSARLPKGVIRCDMDFVVRSCWPQ